ncbi:unnamed protein product [Boreogadus saida]
MKWTTNEKAATETAGHYGKKENRETADCRGSQRGSELWLCGNDQLNQFDLHPDFSGEQMASYFGYSVAVADLNGDGEEMDDVLVGAPLYMEREMESKPREVGRVYLYPSWPHSPLPAHPITGTYTFGRFGTAIATLGDINQDGFNDVAVGCPFGGDDRGGRVLIFNGRRDVAARGLALSQELRAAAPAAGGLPGYGFTLRGGHDLDNNHYPDLIVGAFGVGEISVYRARAVVSVDAWMVLTPKILNADDRQCVLPDTDFMVTWLVNPLAQPLH